MQHQGSKRMLINPPPDDLRCEICHRRIDELESFGEPEDLLDGDAAGTKLAKNFREDYPGYIVPSWECRECILIPYALWERSEMKKLGRELTLKELRHLRKEMEDAMGQSNDGIEME